MGNLRSHQPIPKVIMHPRVIHHLDLIWMAILPWDFLPVDLHLEANQALVPAPDLVTDRHSQETLVLVLDLVLMLDLVLILQPLADQLDLVRPAITRTSILVSVDSIFDDNLG